jgi:oxygen-independent coproporphyrinogen-3 oxidase
MQGSIVERTVDAIRRDIEASRFAGRPAKTIFFGGGTPTFLEAPALIGLLDAVRRVHPPTEGCEITSEANPGTVDASKFAAMRTAGFNRISIGAQSFLDSDLKVLERVHAGGDIERAVGAAREAGFENLNLDLMFALPHQSLEAWRRNLGRALGLQPDHLSLYCLTIEPNTAFYKRHLRGQLHQPDDESQVAMYDACLEETARAGLAQYEISNFAKPGQECRHNLAYWRAEEYAAYGPGAVGCMVRDGVRVRTTNLKQPVRYCEAVEAGAKVAYEWEELDEATQRLERIMLGLRLNEGLPTAHLALDTEGLKRCRERNWIRGDDPIRLTPEGRHFCSEVALALA